MIRGKSFSEILSPRIFLKLENQARWNIKMAWLISSAVLLTSSVILFFDLHLKLGAAVPVLYTGVIWIAAIYPRRFLIFVAALVCSGLTLVGLFYSPEGLVPDGIILLNRGLGFFVIWLTAVFLSQKKSYEQRNSFLTQLSSRIVNGAFLTDSRGVIEWSNEGLSRLLIPSGGATKHKSLFALLSSADSSKIDRLKTSIRNGEAFSEEIKVSNFDDKALWLKFDVEPTFDEFGQVQGSFGLITDISDVKESQAQLSQYLNYAGALVSRMNKAVMVVDSDYKLELVNPAAKRLFGLSDTVELSDFELRDFFGEESQSGRNLLEVFSDLVNSKDNQVEIEESISARDYRVGLARLGVETKGKEKFTITLVDVTEYKEAVRTLESANDELKQFAYVASHDLQEPLRKISSFLQILEEDHKDALNEEARECIDFAVDGSIRLKGLIEDLLAFTGLSRSKDLPLEKVDCGEVLDVVLDGLEEVMTESGARIAVGELPVVQGVKSQLEQLFQNLISNGIKYRRESISPELEVSAEKKGRHWRFKVSDNGIGIDPKYKSKVFRIFQRLHSKQEYPGTGIGLAICKRIVEAHGGKIWFESIPSEGTSFYFTLRRL